MRSTKKNRSEGDKSLDNITWDLDLPVPEAIITLNFKVMS